MNRTIKTLFLTGALTVAGGALAFGGGHHGMGGKDCNRDRPGMARITELEGITDAQREKLEQLRTEKREATRALRNEMQQNRQALRDAMQDGAADDVAALARKQSDLVEQMILQRFQAQQKVNGILTDEQRQELAKQRLDYRGGPAN